MKILVYDDSEINRASARLLLGAEHELTVVATYDEAQDLLRPRRDHTLSSEIRKKLLTAHGLEELMPFVQHDIPDAERSLRDSISSQADREATDYPEFDAVLTDLMVLPSGRSLGRSFSAYEGVEMPLGTTIALLAIYVGIKKVAVVTNMNHHKHPAAAAFDAFCGVQQSQHLGSRVMCLSNVWMIYIDIETGQYVSSKFLQSEEGKRKYPRCESSETGFSGLVNGGKNWKYALDKLNK